MKENVKRGQQLAGILTENFDAIDGVIRTEAVGPLGAENGDPEAKDKIAALGIMETNEVGDIELKHSGLILPALKAAGLTSYMDEMDDFDIAEAITVYTHNYNENSDLINKLNQLLRKIDFKPARMFSYNPEDLDGFSVDIYNALVDYYENNDDTIDENSPIPTEGEPAPKDETPIQHQPTSVYNESIRMMIRTMIGESIDNENDVPTTLEDINQDTITTEFETYNKFFENDEHIYFIASDSDETGGTLMYSKPELTLISDNFLAYNSLAEDMESGNYTWLSDDAQYSINQTK